MSKRITPHELNAIREWRDDVQAFVGDLFPRAEIKLQMTRIGNTAGLHAQIGSIEPHDPADIAYCLGELGVQSFTDILPPQE